MKQENFQYEFVNFSGELTSFLYRLAANRQDAEDLVQDSYIKAMSNLSSYNAEKASLKTWVFTIALNTAKNQYRSQNPIDVPIHIGEDYDDNFKIVTSKMALGLRESLASALRLMAYLHLKEKSNEEGRASAIGQMRIALELITQSDSSELTKSCKSISLW